MKCPFCGHSESKVVDSRPSDNGEKIRRRRECLKCNSRFTTYEAVETLPIIVIKKDKSREAFDRTKLINGFLRACEKRPIPLHIIENAVNRIEAKIQSSLEPEISSMKVGDYVMDELKEIDKVAYVRFASVYREFEDIDNFMDELKKLIKDKNL